MITFWREIWKYFSEEGRLLKGWCKKGGKDKKYLKRDGKKINDEILLFDKAADPGSWGANPSIKH